MENVNLHKQKMIALAIAALALIAMFLPWTVQKNPLAGFFGGGGSINMNGFRSVGFISFLGVIGVVIASLIGDKTKEYDDNSKKIAMASFGGIVLGALIYFILVTTKSKAYGASGGIGIWIALIAGAAGLAWVMGMIKLPANNPPAPPNSPSPPTPPQS